MCIRLRYPAWCILHIIYEVGSDCCWKTSTYRLRAGLFAIDDLGREGGGAREEPVGVGGAEGIADVGEPAADAARGGGGPVRLGGRALRSPSDAVRFAEGCSSFKLTMFLRGRDAVVGEAVWAREGGGGGVFSCGCSAPAFLLTHFFRSLS